MADLRQAVLMNDMQLVETVAKEAGVVGRYDLSGRFAVESGWGGRDWFSPLDDDADCFLLATRFHGLQLDQIVAKAHATFEQLDLVRRYVRRNVVLAVAQLALMSQEEKYAYGW
ncbi:hypothetical protein [Pseudomonas sp. ML96]|uniref:hypothetical protein n=1 Tax=Pseudomonas sp. ML96 TaxID=1523503 RepID=UPI0005BB1054|nr:hypothetical protein [Pseudomonas sp. ML96]